jgi:hypothetical protein
MTLAAFIAGVFTGAGLLAAAGLAFACLGRRTVAAAEDSQRVDLGSVDVIIEADASAAAAVAALTELRRAKQQWTGR